MKGSIRTRKLAAGILVFAMAGALAPQTLPAQASTSTTSTQVPILVAVAIPCAGEIAVIGGDLHILMQTTITENGGTHLSVQYNPQGVSGLGLTSGNKYQGTGVNRFSLNTSGPPPLEFMTVNNFRVIGQGPHNNLLMHFNVRMTVDENGTPTTTVSNVKVECK